MHGARGDLFSPLLAQVEKAPVSIKANVPKAEAEAIKKQIEAGKMSML
jgi:hypothetical protein